MPLTAEGPERLRGWSPDHFYPWHRDDEDGDVAAIEAGLPFTFEGLPAPHERYDRDPAVRRNCGPSGRRVRESSASP